MTDIRFDEAGDRLLVRAGDAVLAEYVARPDHPTYESPRPYFSPIRTLGGELVSLYRPHDHVWHKGIAWSLPVVGDENFWGGPTFVRGEGYVQLPNNGEQRHVAFERDQATDAAGRVGPATGTARVVERLEWITQAGESIFEEERTLAASVLDDEAWLLGFATRLTNTTDRPISIGSPTTRGRENAGYGGLFWRGPRSFTGGQLLAPGSTRCSSLKNGAGHRHAKSSLRANHCGGCCRLAGSSTMTIVDAASVSSCRPRARRAPRRRTRRAR